VHSNDAIGFLDSRTDDGRWLLEETLSVRAQWRTDSAKLGQMATGGPDHPRSHSHVLFDYPCDHENHSQREIGGGTNTAPHSHIDFGGRDLRF
jgi:hypothetical protein